MKLQLFLTVCLPWLLSAAGAFSGWGLPVVVQAADKPLTLQLRYQQETSLNSSRFHTLQRTEQWEPAKTAIVVCDVWDAHHSWNAVQRLEEFVPRLNDVLTKAREQGVTVIHAPSDCMAAYTDHPARQRAINATRADFVPDDCETWCSVIPAEERAIYPLDQSDGGADDGDSIEQQKWAAKLKAMGRNPGLPWKRQHDAISIDANADFISDKGDEVWNVLKSKGIRNVILTGVHTNMCVLGRPFGLRQMARNGMHVVLMRDMTDTMYNPRSWPFVSHFTGTDLIVSHIERYVCPTITSDQFLGGQPFVFSGDTRPHLVMLIAEQGYQTQQSLPKFAVQHAGRDFRVTAVFSDQHNHNHMPGIDMVREADVLLVSVRRQVLPAESLQLIRDHVNAGKPVVGIRTASHAFALNGKQPPEGHADWPEFDAQVFGGNYHGDLNQAALPTIQFAAKVAHPILNGLNSQSFTAVSTLYLTQPLAKQAAVLATGSTPGHAAQPVAWTFRREDGGRSFYTSLGHVDDFQNPAFAQLLYQGLCWAAKISPTVAVPDEAWQLTQIPLSDAPAKSSGIDSPQTQPADNGDADVWYRCGVRLPLQAAAAEAHCEIRLADSQHVSVWWNGQSLSLSDNDAHAFRIPATAMQTDDANLLVVRVAGHATALQQAPEVVCTLKDQHTVLSLAGRWQWRSGNDAAFASMPLPAKFGAAANIVFVPEPSLWVAQPVTRPGEFTTGIEGPACDAAGNIFAVNFQKQGTIGRISPQGSGEVFVTLPKGSVGNGIRFDKDGNFYVADYPKHNVLKVNTETRKVSVFAHDDRMNQPNDLAIAPNGTLYASDPNWKDGTGQLWHIDTDGKTTLLASDMGTTNGIEVSPDGKHLYVNESVQRNVWAFDITAEGTLNNKRLIKQFEDHGFDGMRCDVDGNLYITRHGKGTVVKMTPQGDVLQEIHVLGSKPTNLCFGGPDGQTVYVTEVDGTRLVSFRADRPGRSWAERQ